MLDFSIIDREIQLLQLIHQSGEQFPANNMTMLDEAALAGMTVDEMRDLRAQLQRELAEDMILLKQKRIVCKQAQINLYLAEDAHSARLQAPTTTTSASSMRTALSADPLHALHQLPNEIQQLIYSYAMADEDSLIALIYTSATVRANLLKIVCLQGDVQTLDNAVDIYQYWRATKAEPWPTEWRGRWCTSTKGGNALEQNVSILKGC